MTSWDLVGAAQTGDRAAFGHLYERYAETVFRYILIRVGDRALAEDFTGDVFIRALRRIDSVSYQGADVGAWFTVVARNIVFDHFKSHRHRLTQLCPRIGDELGDHIDDRTPLDDVLTAEAAGIVTRAVACLGAGQRECVELRFLAGLSVAETAAVMGRSVGAVKTLQFRAVRVLAGMREVQAWGEASDA
jgi:RNA polymerase sigma-70 factor, ECF subfamily